MRLWIYHKIIFVLAVAFLGIIGCNQQEKAITRPNIIFLLTDDQKDKTLGAMGHPFVRTPNLDSLLNNGVRFSNTYIAEPVCSPSRTSFFTGMHERIHGIGFSSSYQLTEEQWEETYPALLRNNEYYTGFIGKFGVEYYTFFGEASKKFDFWYAHDGWSQFFPKECPDYWGCSPYLNAKHDIITPIMGEGIENFLDSVPKNQPFCLSVSFNIPHGSQTKTMYKDYEGWKKMSRPANQNSKLKDQPFYDTLYRNINIDIPPDVGSNPYQHIPKHVLDHEQGRSDVYIYDYSAETTTEHHIRYYQTITGMDHVVGNMLRKIKKMGIADNTIIIFASDHGLLMGEYGMGGKALLYDLTSKITCFIYDPRLPAEKRGRDIDALVSSLDIPVTILDYAGLAPAEFMSGHSLAPLMNGVTDHWRQELFLESLFTLRDNPFCEGIRIGRWKYIRMYEGVLDYKEEDLDFTGQPPDFEQLFNIEDDPEEKINLIDEYKDTDLLDSLRMKVTRYSDEMNEERKRYMSEREVVQRRGLLKKN